MAKQTVRTLLNLVLEKTGQSTVSATQMLTLSGLALFTFHALQEALYEVYEGERYNFNEATGRITMSSATVLYARPSDMMFVDRDSFINRKSDKRMKFVTPNQFDEAHKDWREADKGDPGTVFLFRDRFFIFPKPNASSHGTYIDFRYWTKGPVIGTNTASQTATIQRFPEEYEVSLIVNLAAYKVMARRGSTEAIFYEHEVFGDPNDENRQGALRRMRESYRSEILGDAVDMDYVF